MNDDALRAAFARQEVEELDVYALRSAIDTEAGRRRRRRSLALTGGLAVLVALAITIPLLLVRGNVPASLPVAATSPAVPAKPLNLLLLGVDRSNGTSDPGRADSITIVHVSASRKQVHLISLSRDLYVEIPGHGKDKINASYFYGGPKLVALTVTKLTGVPIDGTVAISNSAMRGVIDTLGGVEVCLEHKVTSIHTKAAFPSGCQTLDGAQADDLVRQRQDLPNGSYDRDRNGQRVLAGVLAKVRELNLITDPVKVARLIGIKGVIVDGPSSTVEIVDQLRPAVSASVIGLGGSTFNSTVVDGLATEKLPTSAPALFKAVLADDVQSFVVAHPEWVTTMRS